MSKQNFSQGPAAYGVIKTSDAASRLEKLQQEASLPGAQRQRFIKSLSLIDDDDYAVCIKYNRSFSSISKQGTVPVSFVEVDGEQVPAERKYDVGVNPKLKNYEMGAAPANKLVGGAVIPCGVCLVIGGGGSGKTPLAHALAAHGVSEYAIVRIGEPLAGYTSDNEVAASSLARALLSHDNIVLDSIKDLLSSGGGSAMKSGISRDALVSLSGWAIAACEVGSTIYIPVNPSTKDKDVLDLLVEISKSNATMTVVNDSGGQWSYYCRSGEGLERKEGKLSLTFDARTGVPSVQDVDDVAASKSQQSKPLPAMVVSIEAMNNAVRRSIEQH